MIDPKKLSFLELIKVSWKPYSQLAAYLKPYKFRLIIGMLCGLGFASFNALLPVLVYKVGGNVFSKGGGNYGLGKYSQLMHGGFSGPQMHEVLHTVIYSILLIPAVMLVRALLGYANSHFMNWVSLKILVDLRRDIFSSMIWQSLDFFNKAKGGKLLSRIMNDSRTAQEALVAISANVLKDPFAAVATLVVLFMIDWKFCVATLILFPTCLVPIIIYGKRVRKAAHIEESEAGAMTVILQETFAGAKVVKSFAREEYQVAQFEKSGDIQFTNGIRMRNSMDMTQPMIEVIAACGASLAIIYVVFEDKPLTELGALLLGSFLLYEPIKRLSRLHLTMQRCLVSTTNLFELMSQEASVKDLPNAAVLDKCTGRLEFSDVTFSYRDDQAAVKNVSLVVEPGKKYALVGSSGAGKSTMLSLILRFYEIQSGAILIDGHDIRSITQHSLREHIGIVTQDTFLFHDTIYENIRYGRLDATEAEVYAAAKLAYAHDFILAQPEGYHTVVGDKGCLLSGGQQQRLTIARALLKSAPILLLDEATSALDTESERMIQAALERLTHGRTVIAIAHRLSTILNSDQIVVMDHGHIIEVGSHAELLASSVQYKKLYELQFNHDESGLENAAAV